MSQSQVALSILASARGAVALLVLREAGVHRSQARPKPGPATAGPSAQMPGERFGGLVSAGPTGWRTEPVR